jgi:hypothetical protein
VAVALTVSLPAAAAQMGFERDAYWQTFRSHRLLPDLVADIAAERGRVSETTALHLLLDISRDADSMWLQVLRILSLEHRFNVHLRLASSPERLYLPVYPGAPDVFLYVNDTPSPLDRPYDVVYSTMPNEPVLAAAKRQQLGLVEQAYVQESVLAIDGEQNPGYTILKYRPRAPMPAEP